MLPENGAGYRDMGPSARQSLRRKFLCRLESILRIRRLTPLECFRLMGFDDEDYQKVLEAGISNSQAYKQAGNSIVVNVLTSIFEALYSAMPYLFEDVKIGSFFPG